MLHIGRQNAAYWGAKPCVLQCEKHGLASDLANFCGKIAAKMLCKAAFGALRFLFRDIMATRLKYQKENEIWKMMTM
jgi:hypothetical protein